MNLVSVSIFNNIKEYVSIMSRFYESVMIVRGLSPFLMVCKMMQNDAKCTRCVWSGKVTLRTDSNHTRLFVSWPWDLWKIRCPAQSHVPSSVQHQVQLLLTVRDVPGISAQERDKFLIGLDFNLEHFEHPKSFWHVLICGGRLILSYAHWDADLPTNGQGTVPRPETWSGDVWDKKKGQA